MRNEGPVLIVAAHPDDEVLGCGGTIAKLASSRDVHTVFLADGEAARGSSTGVAKRQAAAIEAARILGAKEPRFLAFPDNRLDTVALIDVVQSIEAVVAELKPTTVFTHFGGDLNIDHQITHRAVMTACRPLPEAPVRSIYAMEVLSSTEWAPDRPFIPNVFVDISGQLNAKLGALACYESEMRLPPHARSVQSVKELATVRGASVGLAATEAFTLLRQTIQ